MYYRKLIINGNTYNLAANLTGSGAPTTYTEGLVGMLYMNTDDGAFYKCVDVAGSTYYWEPLIPEVGASVLCAVGSSATFAYFTDLGATVISASANPTGIVSIDISSGEYVEITGISAGTTTITLTTDASENNTITYFVVVTDILDITQNGPYNVSEYAKINVNVPIPDGYVKPLGTLIVNENNKIIDVSSYAEIDVRIPIVEPEGIAAFSFNGKKYGFEQGMTWEEWIASEYNAVGAYHGGDYDTVVIGDASMIVSDTNMSSVALTDEIIANHTYSVL